jgi:hypothetical protein
MGTDAIIPSAREATAAMIAEVVTSGVILPSSGKK